MAPTIEIEYPQRPEYNKPDQAIAHPTCSTCRFHFLEMYDALIGQCRFDPPVTYENHRGIDVTRWPLTRIDSWCGKYKPLGGKNG